MDLWSAWSYGRRTRWRASSGWSVFAFAQCQVPNLPRILLSAPPLFPQHSASVDKTHLNEYLAASLKCQSASPACSFCPHKSNICCTLPPKHSSNDLITAAPAVNFTLFHSFTRALMVHNVLINTVWVVEVVALVWRCDRQVWRLLSKV